MSRIKNAQLRYRIIDRSLRNPYKRFPTKSDLRQACEEAIFGSTVGADICDSTIEKDMFAMRMEFDAPIKYSKREKGYFYEDEEYSIDKIPLSDDDVEAIKFASQTLMQFRGVDIFKQFGFAIDKIFDRVHISNNPGDVSVENYVQFETVQDAVGSDLLPSILKAIKEKQIVKFDYTSFITEQKKGRIVLPLLLKEYRNRWYMISYSFEKEMVITFGLDRITGFEITEDYYLNQVDFDPDLFFKHSIGITSNNKKPEKILFRIDKVGSKYLQSQPLHISQKLVKEEKDFDTIMLNVLVSEELKRTLLSYGAQIELLEPNSLKNSLIEQIMKMTEIYKS